MSTIFLVIKLVAQVMCGSMVYIGHVSESVNEENSAYVKRDDCHGMPIDRSLIKFHIFHCRSVVYIGRPYVYMPACLHID